MDREEEKEQTPYAKAVIEFIAETIRNPNFFKKKSSEQRKIARSYINKHKNNANQKN